MSYECGIGPGLGALVLHPRSPGLRCDGCGIVRSVTNCHGMPYSWLLDNRAAPKWHMKRDGAKRLDLCPDCWALAKAAFERKAAVAG